jgi:hypothetical protein
MCQELSKHEFDILYNDIMLKNNINYMLRPHRLSY